MIVMKLQFSEVDEERVVSEDEERVVPVDETLAEPGVVLSTSSGFHGLYYMYLPMLGKIIALSCTPYT